MSVPSTSWAQILAALCLQRRCCWSPGSGSFPACPQKDRHLVAEKESASCLHHLVLELPLVQLSVKVGKQGSIGLYFVLD